MSTHSATVTEVARHFSEYVNRVAYGRDRFVLLRGGRALAELRPCVETKRVGDLPAILAGLPKLSPEDLQGFEGDLRALRSSIPMEAKSPWDA